MVSHLRMSWPSDEEFFERITRGNVAEPLGNRVCSKNIGDLIRNK